MASVAKFTKAATGHICAHYERKKDERGQYYKFHNQSIDPERTPLNYNLAPPREGGQVEFIRRRLSEVKCLKRDDVKVLCTWVVTLPKYSRVTDGTDLTMTYDDAPDRAREAFFERTYRFLSDRYGERNVISAYIHMDEVTPHMHFAFIPVTDDRKRGGEKVSAKEVLTKADLQAFHGDFEKYLDGFNDWRFEVLNEATRDGNKEVAELKKETALREVKQARLEALEARRELENVRDDITRVEEIKDDLEGEIEALRARKDTLTAAEVNAMKGTKTVFGGLKDVSYNEFEALKKTAARVGRVEAERDMAVSRADAAERNAAAIKAAAENQIREIKAKSEKLPMQARMEHAALRARFDRMVRWLNQLLDRLPPQFKTFVRDILADRDPFRHERDMTRDRERER